VAFATTLQRGKTMFMHSIPVLAVDRFDGALLFVYIAVVVIGTIFSLWCACRISGKLGHSPWMGLLLIVPGVGLLGWMVFCAFAEAPNETAARRARKRNKSTARSQGPAPRTAGGSAGGSAWASTPEDRAADALDDLFD
jgi:hypothetical protein